MYKTKERSERRYYFRGHGVHVLPSKKQLSTIKSLSRRHVTAAASCVGPKKGPAFQQQVHRQLSVMIDVIYSGTVNRILPKDVMRPHG